MIREVVGFRGVERGLNWELGDMGFSLDMVVNQCDFGLTI